MYEIDGVLYLSAASFARLLGRDPSRVKQLRIAGRFDGWCIRHGGRWLYRLDEAQAFARERGK